MSNCAKPTLLERLDLVPAIGGALLTAAAALVTGLWRGPNEAPSLYLHVMYAATRRLVARCSAAQLQCIFPHTQAVYQQQAKAFQMMPRVVDLPHGARGNWIGDPDAEHVLVWYHGGGFVMPASDGHVRFFMRFIQSRPKTRPSLSVFFLEYTLAPTASYPTQLTQAVEAVRHLVTATKRSPSSIILGGDSAGGNLVAGVLSHLTHRHAAIDELTLTGPLAAAVMMAPWTAMNEPDARLAGDDGGDVITKAPLGHWARNYMGGGGATATMATTATTPDYYTDASRAPSGWFRGLPVNQILVMAGQHEYLLPQIDAFVRTLQTGYGPVEFYVADKEAHIAPFVNLLYEHNAPTGQGTKLVDWIEAVVA
ncbi:hypothetical protein E4U41_000811 [Claviceps citrina]|nr:hypothetical protein E4U41_000811 [Claviceps citrina]